MRKHPTMSKQFLKEKAETDREERLRAVYDEHLQRDSDDSEDESIFWSHTLHRCKACKQIFSKLRQHLSKQSECQKEYSEELLNDIEDARNMYSGRRKSKKYYENHGKREKAQKYQENKGEIARKYQENKASIRAKNNTSYNDHKYGYVETRAKYYQDNKDHLSQKSKKYHQDNKTRISERYKRDKKEAEELQAKADLEKAIEVRLEHFDNDELRARNINRMEGEFLKDTRQKQIKKLKLNALSAEEKQKLINFEKLIIHKYNSFEKEIDAIMIHVNDFKKENFETREEMFKKEKIIDRKFHQLYKAIYRKDEPESPDRILKEWKEVQNEVDIELIALSLKLNVPVPYSPKCWSNCKRPCDLHIYPDPDELRNEWTKYIEDTEENSVMRSKIIRNYTSVLFNIYNKKNPLEF